MERLEIVISNNKWKIEYNKDKTTSQSYWGADTQQRIIFIYNTVHNETINYLLKNAEQQYRNF